MCEEKNPHLPNVSIFRANELATLRKLAGEWRVTSPLSETDAEEHGSCNTSKNGTWSCQIYFYERARRR